jgi:hypothetical protein
VRRVPAHPRRRRPARRLRRPSRGLSRGPPHPGRDRQRGRRPDRQHRGPARPAAGEVHRRAFRAADGHRHPARAREARPRPAPRVHHRDLRRGRGENRGPGTRHGARGRGHQRRGVRRVRGRRRAPGRPGPRVRHVARTSSPTRTRWSSPATWCGSRCSPSTCPGTGSRSRCAWTTTGRVRPAAATDRAPRAPFKHPGAGSSGRPSSPGPGDRKGETPKPQDSALADALRRAGLVPPQGPTPKAPKSRDDRPGRR